MPSFRSHFAAPRTSAWRRSLLAAGSMALVALGGFAAFALAEEPSAEDAAYFTDQVHPLLKARCFKCHHGDGVEGELQLDSLAGALAGGESGPAIAPGAPDESLLIEAINYESFEMPPDKQLAAEEIAILTEWVRRGAPWPGADPNAPRVEKKEKITAEDRAWWAFQPLGHPTPPQADDPWCRNDVDRFILAGFDSAGLSPAAEADELTLLRRVTYDLTGLPPTPEETAAFAADKSPDAYEKLVDRLLESPRYGERQARQWLDLVHYAESDGFRQDAFRPQAYRYRDWVISSFNDDKPYDRFVTEQLAGDEFAPDDPAAQVATGYYRLGVYEYNQRDAVTQRRDMFDDITDLTGEVFLGLSFGCAKCHDHKFDPILQKDYYRLQAFFAPMLFRDDAPVADAAALKSYREKLAAWEAKTAELREKIAAIEAPHFANATNSAVKMFPEDVQAIYRKPAAERDSHETQLSYFVHRQALDAQRGVAGRIKGEAKRQWEELKKQLAAHDADKPTAPPTTPAVQEHQGPISPTQIPGKRNAESIEPGFLTLLTPDPATIEPSPTGTSGRRLALARWITDPENPLSNRVIVNRIWQSHFGRGLVPTSSDFGRLGEAPSHPELLDWLARRFAAEGHRFKALHRLIVTSATYRQTALRPTPEIARQVDPANKLWWRMQVRRLDAEQIRDALLAVGGGLSLEVGGPSVSASSPRRSIYTKSLRNTPDALLDAFDLPQSITSTPLRNVTTTPTQSLLMINSASIMARAKALASRLRKTAGASPEKLVDAAYQLVYTRPPLSVERERAVAFLRGAHPAPPVEPARQWVKAFPTRTGDALEVAGRGASDVLRVPNADQLPDGDFTVEAYVLLRSLYPDASVRTIAAHWDSNTGHPGWALGVTSHKSQYKPRNLILQLVGDPAQGGAGYEVVASNLHLELNQPYYVAASVRIADTSLAGVTFYVQSLAGEGPMQVAHAAHKVTGHYRSKLALTLGGRDHREERHHWDGLLDDVRVTAAALPREELLIASPTAPPQTVGFWRFEKEPGVWKSSLGAAGEIVPIGLAAVSPDEAALIDFCHVLLNSNEMLYLD